MIILSNQPYFRKKMKLKVMITVMVMVMLVLMMQPIHVVKEKISIIFLNKQIQKCQISVLIHLKRTQLIAVIMMMILNLKVILMIQKIRPLSNRYPIKLAKIMTTTTMMKLLNNGKNLTLIESNKRKRKV